MPPTIASSTPATTANPITPAAFGPMACISRKLEGLFLANLLATRAAILVAVPQTGKWIYFAVRHAIHDLAHDDTGSSTVRQHFLNKNAWRFSRQETVSVGNAYKQGEGRGRYGDQILIRSFCAVRSDDQRFPFFCWVTESEHANQWCRCGWRPESSDPAR